MADEQDVHHESEAGPDTSAFLDYLRLNREFLAPAVSAAVSSLPLAVAEHPLRILDAGTGGGGALLELVDLLHDRGGRVVAVDIHTEALAEARHHPFDGGVDQSAIDIRQADLRGVAKAAREDAEPFDVIWSSDVIWPATFDDPGAVVAELAAALAPGGTLALFTSNYYQSMFLPGHSRIERLIRTASELTWKLPDGGPDHYERLGAWMRQAGLQDVRVRVFSIASSTADPTARAYLERVVWPEMRHAVSAHARAAGMSDADVTRAEQPLNPAGDEWVGNDTDGFVVQPMLLWT